jgi:hypothetical protein
LNPSIALIDKNRSEVPRSGCMSPGKISGMWNGFILDAGRDLRHAH